MLTCAISENKIYAPFCGFNELTCLWRALKKEKRITFTVGLFENFRKHAAQQVAFLWPTATQAQKFIINSTTNHPPSILYDTRPYTYTLIILSSRTAEIREFARCAR